MMPLYVEADDCVSVENWAAECHVRFRIAVGADGHVPPGHHELELIAARLAEDGDTLIDTPFFALRVVLELLEELAVPVRIDDSLEDVVDDRLLFLGVKPLAVGDAWLGDV